MTKKLVYVSEELTQALYASPDASLNRLGVLAALDVLEEGDLKAVCFFATRFSGRQANLPEVAEALLWLLGHRYVQARPAFRRDVFWQRPREIKLFCLSPEGRALYARVVSSAYRDYPPHASSFDRHVQRVACSRYTFWGLFIISLMLIIIPFVLPAHR